MRYKADIRKFQKVITAVLLVLICSITFFAGAKQVFADAAAGFIPTNMKTNGFTGANCNGQAVADGAWLSAPGDTLNTTVNVAYGASTVDLWYNLETKSCLKHTQDSTFFLIDIPQANVFQYQEVPYPGPYSTGTEDYYIVSVLGITAIPRDVNGNTISSLTTSGTYYIDTTYKAINKIRVGASIRYDCVTNPGDVNNPSRSNFPPAHPTNIGDGQNDFNRCGSIGSEQRPIFINVPPNPDMCLNIPGVQNSVPPGYYRDGAGNCYQIDVCPNIPGVQGSVPPGYVIDGNGNCIQPDVCPNIAGAQASVPPGLIVDGNGNCVLPDVCPNIPGQQDTVPAGKSLINGNCVDNAPYGYIDSCKLEPSGTVTTIEGWAYDADAPTSGDGNGTQPRVSVTVTGVTTQSNLTTDVPYRTAQINPYIDSVTPGGPHNPNYGFAPSYSNLRRGTVYGISGTVNNYGQPGTVNLLINTSATVGPSLNGVGFPGNNIPDSCLPISFAIKAAPQLPNLKPDDESPTSVDFAGAVAYANAQKPNVKGINWTRKYYIKKISGAPNVTLTGPGVMSGTLNFTGSDLNLPTENVSLPAGLVAGDQVCQDINMSPPSGIVDASGNLLFKDTDVAAVTSCKPLANEPYMRVYGGDTISGASFNGGVCAAAAADITGYSKQTAGGWVGAGSQFGAFASGDINTFASANLFAPNAPTTLSFANTINGATNSGPKFGGQFNGNFCAHEYWPAAGPPAVSATTDIDASTAGQITLAANTTLTQSAALTKSTTIYVDGNLIIGSSLSNGGSWTAGSVPLLYVIVRGNIYVLPGVIELDGLYVAEPTNATNGHIWTCYNTTEANTDSNFIATKCGSKLTVYGALLAQKVNFLRTPGSLRAGRPAELAGSPNIAETIQFSPEMLMGVPARDKGTKVKDFDSIIGLPPSL